MLPSLILGGYHSDDRGDLKFNNNFNALLIKRMYIIENKNISIVRAWQGHKIEQRWFTALSGSFKIELIEIDNWKVPSKDLKHISFIINSDSMDILHIPKGYVSSIKATSEESKLLVMSDYGLNEVNDEYRFLFNYFE